MRHNVFKLYLIKISKWFMLYMPIVALFYQNAGLESGQLLIIQALFSILVVLMEVPSGYLADVWGRKATLVAGTVLGTLGFVAYSISGGFWEILLAESILAIGYSFISGADSAMLYDSLADLKQQDRYLMHEGRIGAAGNFSESIAALAGGALAEISLRLPFYVQSGIAFLAIPVAISIVNPTSHLVLGKPSLEKFKGIIMHSFYGNKMLRYSVLLSSFIGAATLTMAWFAQLYFVELEIERYMFGLLWMLLNLTVGGFSWFASFFERALSPRIIIWGLAILIPFIYLFLGYKTSIYGIAFLFIFYALRGIATPFFKDLINRQAQSENRATILSLRSFIIRILFSSIAIPAGILVNRLSLNMALFVSGVIFLAASLATAALYLKIERNDPKNG